MQKNINTHFNQALIMKACLMIYQGIISKRKNNHFNLSINQLKALLKKN